MSSASDLIVACVLRSGGDYDAEYVARLRAGVEANLSIRHRFVCLSDVPVPSEWTRLDHDWPGWWSKMELCRRSIKGDVLYLDLDTIITGPLDGLAAAGRLTMLSDFFVPRRPASGLMWLPESARAEAWRAFTQDPAGHMARHAGDGDQGFLAEVWGRDVARWQDSFPGRVVSFKADKVQQRGVPAGASVVCFHGKPRPRDIGWQLRLSPSSAAEPSASPSSAPAQA